MQIDVLYSSSDGNACRVSSGHTSILIDCGVPRSKLFAKGKFPIDAVFISHEHGDHISGAYVLGKHEKISIYLQQVVFELKQITEPTFFDNLIVNYINPGDSIEVGELKVHVYESCHDSQGGLNFIVEEIESGRKFAHITDTGMVNGDLIPHLKGCQGLLIEANHDIKLLEDYEDYPLFLKERIRGDTGHLSNSQAFDLIDKHLNLKTIDWIVFGHLSKKTNKPSLVLKEARKRFPGYKSIHLAPVDLDL